jgi:hypothetical protein
MADVEAFESSRTFFAFATKWSRAAREKALPPEGQIRGVFSATLMNGLRGGACEGDSGDITARSLADYLYEGMKVLLDPKELEDPTIPKEPQVFYDPSPSSRFVIATAVPARVPVVVDVGETGEGKAVEITTTGGSVERAAAAPRRWNVSLPKGLFVARMPDQNRQKPFEVKGFENGLCVTIP